MYFTMLYVSCGAGRAKPLVVQWPNQQYETMVRSSNYDDWMMQIAEAFYAKYMQFAVGPPTGANDDIPQEGGFDVFIGHADAYVLQQRADDAAHKPVYTGKR